MENNKLVKAQSGQIEISKGSSRLSSGVTAAKMVELAAAVTGYKELSDQENDLWLELLEPYPAERIEKAFKVYLARNQFFPKPAEILALMGVRAEEVHAQREIDRTAAMLAENRKTREQLAAAGLPSGIEQYSAFMKEAKQIVKRMPDPPPGRREELLKRIEAIRARV